MHLHSNPIEPLPSRPPLLSWKFWIPLVEHANTLMGSTPCAMVVVEVQATRAMHALCRLLRGKGHCGGKLTDVSHAEERPIIPRTFLQPRNSEDDEELTRQHPRTWIYGKTVLETGDSSRNVIELIFRATTTDITRCSTNIKQVLKLNHSRETIERFESFREGVKNRASLHYHKHSRNMVDGNEQLLFCGTKPTRCKQFGTSKLCRDSNCSICNIFKSGFHTTKKKTGMWMSTSCEDLINSNTNAKMVNVNMAILVCRVITGKVIDMLDRDFEGDYDSVGGVKSNYLLVRNPSAVLPCFVMIINCT
ncbi:hypothetical protein L1887_39235 [Cichorium endivia]|nr:hypothetical protein L1887_39235 [Cichorium endivia]